MKKCTRKNRWPSSYPIPSQRLSGIRKRKRIGLWRFKEMSVNWGRSTWVDQAYILLWKITIIPSYFTAFDVEHFRLGSPSVGWVDHPLLVNSFCSTLRDPWSPISVLFTCPENYPSLRFSRSHILTMYYLFGSCHLLFFYDLTRLQILSGWRRAFEISLSDALPQLQHFLKSIILHL